MVKDFNSFCIISRSIFSSKYFSFSQLLQNCFIASSFFHFDQESSLKFISRAGLRKQLLLFLNIITKCLRTCFSLLVCLGWSAFDLSNKRKTWASGDHSVVRHWVETMEVDSKTFNEIILSKFPGGKSMETRFEVWKILWWRFPQMVPKRNEFHVQWKISRQKDGRKPFLLFGKSGKYLQKNGKFLKKKTWQKV